MSPDEIGLITRGLASERPPTNPLVVLKAASVVVYSRNGWNRSRVPVGYRVGAPPATDTPSDVDRFDDFLDYPRHRRLR